MNSLKGILRILNVGILSIDKLLQKLRKSLKNSWEEIQLVKLLVEVKATIQKRFLAI